MADKTSIEWTRGADGSPGATWNPITGCSVVSPGCTNCYAMRLAGTRLQHHPSRAGLTQDTKAGPVWTGEVRFNEPWLDQPLRWKRPRMIFVCAHGDLFHESVPAAWIDQVFAVMALAPQHTFQVLTKRADRMRSYMTTPRTVEGAPWDRWTEVALGFGYAAGRGYRGSGGQTARPLPNVWLGVSAEDQKRADERIPHLLATPAAVRWVSAEPLLTGIDLTNIRPDATMKVDALAGYAGHRLGMRESLPRVDWVVAGGESGPGARPMHPDWARSLRDQCAVAGVPFHFKQHGEWREWDHQPATEEVDNDSEIADAIAASAINPAWISQDGRVYLRREVLPPDVPCRLVERIGKSRAGRLLDGVEHNGMPGDAP